MNVKTDAGARGVITTEQRRCVGRTTIPLSAAAPKLLSDVDAIPAAATAALIQADGGSVRIRLDGGVPTASVGQRIDDGIFYPVDSDLAGVRLLAQAGATTVAQVVYFDRP